jgi:hypothetical protein
MDALNEMQAIASCRRGATYRKIMDSIDNAKVVNGDTLTFTNPPCDINTSILSTYKGMKGNDVWK